MFFSHLIENVKKGGTGSRYEFCRISDQLSKFYFGTIHLRRRQIFTIFDPYPPTIGIPAKCL